MIARKRKGEPASTTPPPAPFTAERQWQVAAVIW
jgi:hypothetical protein